MITSTFEQGEKILQQILNENLFDDEVKRMVEDTREDMRQTEQLGDPHVAYPAYDLKVFLETWW